MRRTAARLASVLRSKLPPVPKGRHSEGFALAPTVDLLARGSTRTHFHVAAQRDTLEGAGFLHSPHQPLEDSKAKLKVAQGKEHALYNQKLIHQLSRPNSFSVLLSRPWQSNSYGSVVLSLPYFCAQSRAVPASRQFWNWLGSNRQAGIEKGEEHKAQTGHSGKEEGKENSSGADAPSHGSASQAQPLTNFTATGSSEVKQSLGTTLSGSSTSGNTDRREKGGDRGEAAGAAAVQSREQQGRASADLLRENAKEIHGGAAQSASAGGGISECQAKGDAPGTESRRTRQGEGQTDGEGQRNRDGQTDRKVHYGKGEEEAKEETGVEGDMESLWKEAEGFQLLDLSVRPWLREVVSGWREGVAVRFHRAAMEKQFDLNSFKQGVGHAYVTLMDLAAEGDWESLEKMASSAEVKRIKIFHGLAEAVRSMVPGAKHVCKRILNVRDVRITQIAYLFLGHFPCVEGNVIVDGIADYERDKFFVVKVEVLSEYLADSYKKTRVRHWDEICLARQLPTLERHWDAEKHTMKSPWFVLSIVKGDSKEKS